MCIMIHDGCVVYSHDGIYVVVIIVSDAMCIHVQDPSLPILEGERCKPGACTGRP